MELDNKYKCVYYDRKKRTKGKSKFKSIDLINLALNGISSISIVPIKFIFLSGLFMFMSSIVILIIVLINYINNKILIQGWTSTIFLILFFGGLQNIYLGIIGEYLSKTYIETKSRPIYSIRNIYK